MNVYNKLEEEYLDTIEVLEDDITSDEYDELFGKPPL